MTVDDPKDGPVPEEEAARTIFQPLPGASSQAPPPAQTPTEFNRAEAVPPPPPATPSQARRIEIGDVLNHIFEVRRFIARGGMGEVFEGVNVNSDERVAIKVILPALAADPNVQAMFRKEARTLTRISHPALVQYRVLAQEPNLGVFYIVTEYIDGQNLSDILKTLDLTPAQMCALLKRLAGGLSAAHALGAIHRDISPDNVMLDHGNLGEAKIIDFGIAKDLDPSSATIVGDGFAGKLNYVAPEQLGDFNREVGPWSDVYSLGLVMLAIARKADVDMGGTLVDAVDKRRAGPDISVVPPELRPILEKMLRPNPADRVRSMEEVIELLAAPVAVGTQPSAAASARPPKQPKPPKPPKPARVEGESWVKNNVPLVAGGGVAAAVLIAAGLYFALPGGSEPEIAGNTAVPIAPAADPVGTAQAALSAALPGVACTWLDVDQVTASDQGVSIVLRGVAGKPAEAQGQIASALSNKGVKVAGINFEGVSPIETSECSPLDAFRQVRDPQGGRMTVAQAKWEMSRMSEGEYAGKIGTRAIIDFDLVGGGETSLFGVEPSGTIAQLTPDTATLQAGAPALPSGIRRLNLDTDHKGWTGLLLLSGRPPFDGKLIAGPPGSRSGDWSQRFLSTAKANGWKAEMAWFKNVDEQPN